MALRYSTRSACARVARTAGPLRELRMRNWMPASSVTSAMAPPKASTSLTRWPLPIPPIDGLHDICPKVSTLWVNSKVLQPMRAAASAASLPAWPPPITITSYKSICCIILMPPHKGTHYSELTDYAVAMFHVKPHRRTLRQLLPNTKARENFAQEIVRGDFTGNRHQRFVGAAQFFGE